MKHWKTAVFALIAALCLSGASFTALADRVETAEVTISSDGLVVSLENTGERNAYVRIAKKETDAGVAPQAGQYIALSLKVQSVVHSGGDQYFPCWIGLNDVNLAGDNNVPTHTPDIIEQKWGDWFFIPPGFDGLMYLAIDQYYPENLPGVISALSVAGDGTRDVTFVLRKVFVCDTVGVTAGTDLFDMNFAADADNAVSDARVTGTHFTARKPAGGVEQKVKSAFVTQKTAEMLETAVRADGTAAVGYGWLDIAVDYAPSDGLAFNIKGVSDEAYFKLELIDEHAAVWTPVYFAAGGDIESPIQYPFAASEEETGTLSSMFSALRIERGQSGTLYLDYDKFTSSASEMGRITTIRFGMDMEYGLGRAVALGKLSDVDADATTAITIVDFAALDETELDTEAVGNGSVVSCKQTDAYLANWALRRYGIADSYSFTATAGTGGTASYRVDGTSVVFTAAASAEYELNGATLNGQAVELTDGTYVATDVDGDLTFRAEFKVVESDGGNDAGEGEENGTTPPTEKKGCGSSAVGSFAGLGLLMLAAAAILLQRRRRI